MPPQLGLKLDKGKCGHYCSALDEEEENEVINLIPAVRNDKKRVR